MRTIAICLAGGLALAGCGETERVDKVEPSPVAAEALPADVGQREPGAERRAVSQGDERTPGSGTVAEGEWFAKTENDIPMALFGPPESESLFSVRCEAGRLVFERSGIDNGRPTRMELVAGGNTRRIAATALHDPLPRVTGSLPASDPFAATLATARRPIAVRIDGGPSLRIPAHEHLREVAANCRP